MEGKVDLAVGFTLIWAGAGIKTFTATSSRPVVEGEPTLFEIWVCADGYWADHTKNLVCGKLRPDYAELEERLVAVYDDAVAFCRPGASLAELDRRVRAGLDAIGTPVPVSHPICHGIGARAHEPPYAHQAGGGEIREGMVLAIEPGIYWQGGGGLRVEDNFLITAGGPRSSLPSPTESSVDVEPIDREQGLDGVDQRAGARAAAAAAGRALRHDAARRRAVGRVVLMPEEKLEIAGALDAAGIDRIEAGFPRVSDDDWRAVELIAGAGLNAEIWGFSRAVQADVEALVELGVQASVIESPISDAKLEALGVSRESMLERIRKAVSFAAAHGIRVAFFGVDSSRADLEFFRRAYAAAVEAGAREVVVVDTIGIATPEAAALLVGEAVDLLGHDIPVHWHGHDDFGLATAAAIAAVQAGATWVQGTINGMGERAGNADLIEVALALEALYGIPTRLDLTQARELVEAGAGPGRHAARPVEVRHRREPLRPRVGRRRGAVPGSFRDRAVRVRARRAGAGDRARQEERPRLDQDQGSPSSGWTSRRSARRSSSTEVKRIGTEKRGLVTDDELRRLAAGEPVRGERVPFPDDGLSDGEIRDPAARCSGCRAYADRPDATSSFFATPGSRLSSTRRRPCARRSSASVRRRYAPASWRSSRSPTRRRTSSSGRSCCTGSAGGRPGGGRLLGAPRQPRAEERRRERCGCSPDGRSRSSA